MTQTHTHGPWTITLHGNGLVDGNYRYQIGTNTQTVAYVWMGRENNDPELKANARLICAAPELLEALIEASNIFDNYPEIANELKGTFEVVQKAIAKAIGN